MHELGDVVRRSRRTLAGSPAATSSGAGDLAPSAARWRSVRRPWELLLLVVILGLAAWLRLRELDLMEFKLDEAVAVDLARRVLDGELPTVGLTSSVGARNPPLFVYLTAIPLAVRDDPLAATAFVGVLAVVAVALTYVVLRPRFGKLAALVAAALFATAPWAVLYGRKIWAQDLLPVFATLLLWSLFVVLERPRTRAVALVPVLLCVMFQLNFSALALVAPAAALLLYRARELNWVAFAVGVVAAVLLLGPWLGHQVTHGFQDVELVWEGRGEGSSPPGAGLIEAIRQTTHLLGAANWDYVLGPSHAVFVADAGRAWGLGNDASLLAIILLAVGIATCAVRVARGTRRRRGWPWVELDAAGGRRALLLVWLAGLWLSYATSAPDRVFPHYLIVSYPVSFAVQAVGLADVVAAARARFRRVAALGAITAVALVVAGYLAFDVSFRRFVAEQGGTAGDYGVAYRYKEALAGAVGDRGLRVVDDPVLDYLASGKFESSPGTQPPVTVRNGLQDRTPLPCDGDVLSFGPLSACMPPPPR